MLMSNLNIGEIPKSSINLFVHVRAIEQSPGKYGSTIDFEQAGDSL